MLARDGRFLVSHWLPRLASATIGYSRPFAPCMVMIRTTSSVSSATVASISIASCSIESRRWRMNGRSPPPPAAANRRASSTIASRLAAPCSPSSLVSANSTRRVRSTTRRTISASDTLRRMRCRSRELGKGVVHRLARPLRRRAVGEDPARGSVDDEIVVADRERARAERAHERDPVGRVVDRREHPDQVAHLFPLEEVA